MLGGVEEAHICSALLNTGLYLEKCNTGLTYLSLQSRRPLPALCIGVPAVEEGPLRGLWDFPGQKDGGCNGGKSVRWL